MLLFWCSSGLGTRVYDDYFIASMMSTEILWSVPHAYMPFGVLKPSNWWARENERTQQQQQQHQEIVGNFLISIINKHTNLNMVALKICNTSDQDQPIPNRQLATTKTIPNWNYQFWSVCRTRRSQHDGEKKKKEHSRANLTQKDNIRSTRDWIGIS